MSKLARYRRKIFRHRVVREWDFEKIKQDVDYKKCNRTVNVSTFAFYWKYIIRHDPTRTMRDWRVQMKMRRLTMKRTGRVVTPASGFHPAQQEGKTLVPNSVRKRMAK